MTISMIVPVYNCENYLRFCLDSLTAQRCKDMEIILADDEQILRLGMISMIEELEPKGFTILQARNGKELLALAQQEHPEIAYIDIKMPVMDGLEAFRQMKSVSPETQCFILTGYAEFEYVQSAIHHGALDYLLKPITLEALDHGKHVHCEKPLACTYADAEKMVEKAKQVGKKLTSGLQWRYNAAPLEMKRMIQNGELGEVYYVKSQKLRPRRLPAYGVYTNKELNGGGVLMDGGPHSIDLAMWLTDNYDVATVRGVTFDKMKDYPEGNDLGPWDPENFDVEDTAMAMITMKNGMLIYMETAWITNMLQEAPGVVASVAGTKAGVDMVGPGFETSVRTTKMTDGKLTTEIRTIDEPVNMNEYDINHWIDAIQNGGDPAVLPEQAATVTKVIEAIYESARTGKTVVFD